jgi:hypothetical protein
VDLPRPARRRVRPGAPVPRHLAPRPRRHLLVEAGLGKIPAQAVAIVVVTPVNFVGNKLWSFRK